MQQGKDKECLDDFESAIKINDNVTDIYHHRGQVMPLFFTYLQYVYKVFIS